MSCIKTNFNGIGVDFNNNYCKKIYNTMKDIIVGDEWEYDTTREQARSLLTTICIMEDISVDDKNWDNMLADLYDSCNIGEYEWDYYKFDTFMAENLV